MMLLHSVLSPISFSLAPTSPISSFDASRNLFFGLRLFLFCDNSISITLLLTYSWSLLMKCPYRLTLPSLIFILTRSTLTLLLMYSFLIFSRQFVANFNIFISATSISSTCFFVTATVLSSYTIVGLTTELYTFPFTLAGNLLSQITPDTFRIHSILPALFPFPSFDNYQFLALLIPDTLIPLPLALLCLPSSLFLLDFLHLRTDNRFLTYLLSSLFFPRHYSVRSTSFLVFLKITISSANSIVHGSSLLTLSVSLFIITANRNKLNADSWCSPTLTLKLSVVLIAQLNTVLLPSYLSCKCRT